MRQADIQPLRRKSDRRSTDSAAEKVVVAVKAEKEISRAALAWALTHVVRPGATVMLLAVAYVQPRGRKKWRFPRFAGDCGSGGHRRMWEDRELEISESCSQMVLQFHNAYDPTQINVKIKVVTKTSVGAVAAESRSVGANWVVLDKQLKQEEKHCMKELQCNIVVIKRSRPKVLRLNLCGLHETEPWFSSPRPNLRRRDNLMKNSTPICSPEEQKTSTQVSELNCGLGNLPFYVCDPNPLFEGYYKGESSFREEIFEFEDAFTSFGSDGEESTSPSLHPLLETACQKAYSGSKLKYDRTKQNYSSKPTSLSATYSSQIYWIPQNHTEEKKSSIKTYLTKNNMRSSTTKTLLERFAEFDREARLQNHQRDYVFHSNVREAVSLCRSCPSVPPPLCSICQHKAPVFGKPPRWFSYRELEDATAGFSEVNFLAEGGFGSVHRGVLTDGQVVAVKQLKVASSQGDSEFCAEVEVLSFAQHRNVVMLIGFCIEGKRRVLVYEYICNGSLDFHLFGNCRMHVDWNARVKIACGAARGLRYLHEDCRVGCIVHRDMRPNNILVTHDFEPMVGDFGLARWYPDGEHVMETRVIGTFGYLAPEYSESGTISEKADVYAFGVVLLELMTGQKAVDMTRPGGQQLLAEWARPLLVLVEGGESMAFDRYLDPLLESCQLHQLHAMANAATLCLRRDPHVRPNMSKILKILEGDTFMDPGFDVESVGNRSRRMNSFHLLSQ